MKKLRLCLLLFVTTFVAYSQTQNVSSIGSAITAKEGKTWIKNYVAFAGKEVSTTCDKKILNELITKPGVEGVYILRGLDQSNNEILMFRGTDKNGAIINPELILGPAGFITEETAHDMFEKFQSEFTDRTPGYLFGKRGFETILNQSNAEGIRFINGRDELDVEHLVFVGLDSNGSEQWTASIWNHGSGIFSFFGWGLFSKK